MKKLVILMSMMLTGILSASSSLCAQNPYAHGTYIDDLTCKVESDNTVLYYHSDQQFNVRGLTDFNGFACFPWVRRVLLGI